MKIQKKKYHTVGTFPKSNRKIAERGQIFVYNMIRFYGDVVHKEKQRKFNDLLSLLYCNNYNVAWSS